MSDETKTMTTGKVQCTTSADDATWFREEAIKSGMSQRELFEAMRAAYEERKGTAPKTTEASVEDELTRRIRDLVTGAMADARRDLEGELASEVSRRESAEDELSSAQEKLAECEDVSDLQRELDRARAQYEARESEIQWLRSQISGAKGGE